CVPINSPLFNCFMFSNRRQREYKRSAQIKANSCHSVKYQTFSRFIRLESSIARLNELLARVTIQIVMNQPQLPMSYRCIFVLGSVDLVLSVHAAHYYTDLSYA